MSQSHQAQDANALNANLVAIILIVSSVLIGALIFSNMPLSTAASGSGGEEGAEIALAEATATPTPLPPTPVPSATPLPPTPTSLPPTNTPIPSATPTEAPTAASTPQTVADAGQPSSAGDSAYDPALVKQGAALFAQCAACHGADARGLPNLGKDLVDSEFVAAQTDDALVQFIVTGRPIWDPLNTTGIDMPGKGGNPAMSTEDIEAIVAYIRTLSAQNSGQAEAAPVSNASTSYDPALIEQGAALFTQCAACHGADARGLPNLGKDLVDSEFVAAQTDDALMQFIVTGRPIWDPLNTTGIDMPGKGGNPAMTNEQILAIIAYIRSLAAGA